MSGVAISVAVPAHNAEPWIAETIESVLAQTRPAREVIVVDDGSTDGTLAALEPYRDRVRVVQQDNKGAPAAYNRGFAEATGEYVAMCPADDLWEPRKLEWQANAVVAHPEIDVAFGGARFFGLRDDDYPRPAASGVLEGRAFARAMYEENLVAAPTAVVRRALHERLGGFREDLAIEDYEFWMRALRAGATFFFEPRVLVRHRWHGRNLSSKAVTVRELAYEIHREYGDLAGDPALVRRTLARDLRALARARLGLGRVEDARAAYRASLRQRPHAGAALASLLLRAPGAPAAVGWLRARRA